MRPRDLTDEAREAAALPWREAGLAPRLERVALFRHRALDLFTRSHPAFPYVVVLPLALACAARAAWLGASPLGLVLALALGWIAWSLLEYAMHRFLFHADAKSETARIALLLAHGHHHVWPDDPRRIVATPVQIGSVALLLHGLSTLLLGDPLAPAALAGGLLGYVAYERAHWISHHGRPTSRLARALKDHHMKHHHLAPRSRWGIGTPLWDWVFRSHR